MTFRPRLALVGCGWFASAAHIPALQRLEKNGLIEVVAVCSRSEASLQRAASELGRRNLKKYTGVRALLADPDIDVLDLVLPISIMPEVIQASLQAGKHVISEKPCAPTVAAGSDLLTYYASLDNPPMWAVAENWRFKKLTQVTEQIVRSGTIGTVYFADFRNRVFVMPSNEGWRRAPDYPGGHLLDSGVHFVALLRRVVGEVESVSANVSQRRAHLPPADSVTAVMSFAGGAEGSFCVSFAAQEHGSQRQGLSLVGSDGTVYVNFRSGCIEVHNSAGKRLIIVPDDSWVQGGVYELLAHCVETLRLDTPLRSTPWEALHDVAVIEAMLESSRTRQRTCPTTLYPVLHRFNQSISTYDRIWTFKPRHVVECTSVTDVQSAVVSAVSAGLRVRVMGVGSSWARHLLTRDVCLKLSGMNRIHGVTNHKTAVVDAGVRLGDLTRALAVHGLTLPSLSFYPEVTIGGAVATGTHGTSPKWGTLSDFVRSMKVVLASGEVKKFGPESSSEELCAARVAVGTLGVIVELELQAMDMPWVRFSELRMNLETFLDRRPAILGQYDHVWVHWILGQNEVRVRCLESKTEPASGFHRYVVNDNACWNPQHRAILLLRGLLHPMNVLHSIRSKWESHSAGVTGSEVVARQVWMSMQYGVPASQFETAVDCIRTSDFPNLHPGRVVELKFLKGENRSYLGPNADGDAVLFNLWWFVNEDIKYTVFEPFEKVMRSLHARPHWGKFHVPPDMCYMQMAYPRQAEFETIRARLDPGGTFSIFSE